jgi:hypothetical protein
MDALALAARILFVFVFLTSRRMNTWDGSAGAHWVWPPLATSRHPDFPFPFRDWIVAGGVSVLLASTVSSERS